MDRRTIALMDAAIIDHKSQTESYKLKQRRRKPMTKAEFRQAIMQDRDMD